MPGNTAVGLSFDTTSIKQADEAIKKLVKNAETGIGKVNKAWKDMTKDGLNHFIQRLSVAQKDIAKLSSAQIKVTVSGQADDLKKLGDSASRAIPQVNKLITAMQQLSSIHVNTVGSGGVSAMDAQKVNYLQQQIKLLQDQLKIQQEIGQAVERQAGSTSRVRNGMSGIEDAARKVRQIAGTLFSIQALSGYVNKLVAVRGEFELQQRALQAIVQNIDEANKLWEKTVALAVQSPFRVRELVTYTKQLAAYRVETEKLYDTTKMLADVSAGLGVDMNRLILAFGQVKAANFLRGTELRQFSEAGINILGELATYFTELEGRVVTVGDVFERVSKRMVSFADVEEIFKRITSEGGAFFNMQEIQAETLKGQIANLKDSIDLMLNDIGKANEKTIKNMVAFTRTLVEGWRVVGGMLSSLGAALAVVTIARAKDALATNLWSKANIAATAAGTGLTAAVARMIVSLKGLWAAMLNNPITATYAALAALAVVIYKVVKRQRELNREYEESVGKIHAQYVETKKYADSIKELVERQNELIEANKNLSQDSDEYKENQREISDIEERRKEVIKELVKIDPEYAKSIKNAGSDLEVLIPLAEEYNEKLRARLALESSLKEINVDDSSEKYNDAATEQRAALGNLEKTRNILLKQAQELLSSDTLYDSERKALEDFVNGSEPYYKRAIKLREDLQKVVLDLGTSEQAYGLGTRTVKKTGVSTLWQRLDIEATSAIEKYIKALGKLSRKEKKIVSDMSSVAEEFKGLEMGARLTSILADENATQEDKDKAKNQIIDFFEEVLNEKGIVGAIADKARSLWSSIFNFDWKKVAIPTKLTGWRAAYDEFLKTLSTGAVPSITEEEDESDYIETLKKTYESYAEDIEGWDANNAKLRAQYTKEQMDRIKAENAERKKAIDWLTYEEKETRGTGENKELKELNERIRLVRELRKEYETLNKTFDAQDSANRVRESFRKAWESIMPSDLSIDAFDFTNPQGVVAQLEELKTKIAPEAVELVNAIEKAIAGERVEIDVDFKKGKEKELLNEIEALFDRYDLTLELDKIKAPKGFMKNLFGVDSMSLPMLRAEVESREKDFVGTDMGKDYKELLEKIDDLERKELEQKAKRFVDYLSKNLDKIENIQRGRGLDLSFARELFDEGKISAEMFGEAVQSIVAETNKEISRLNLEKFKESPEYIQAMGDMTAYSAEELRGLSSKLKDIISENGHAFSADELKVYHDALERVNKRLERLDRNFVYDKDVYNLKEIKRLNQEIANQKAKESELNNKLIQQEMYRLSLIVSLENLQKQRDEAKAKGQDTTLLDSLILTTQREIAKANDDVAAMQASLKSSKSLLAELGSELKTILGDETEAFAKLQAYINLFNKSLNAFTGVFGEVKAVVDSFGVDTDSGVWAEISVAMEGLSNVGSKASEAVTKFMSGDPIGGTMAAISMVFEAIKGVNKTIDQVQETKIQEQLKQIESLGDAYDSLEKSIGEAFNAKELANYNAEMATNVDLQLKAYEAAIRAEEAKKNTDPERVRELTQEYNALKESWEEFKNSQLESMGGVSKDGYREATEGFVDAWYEAFQETGNGLEGLKDNFREFFKDVVKQQALTQGATNIMQQLFDEVNKSLEEDYTISDEEYKNIDAVQEKVLKELDTFLKGYYERYGDILQGAEGGGLSALQKGISGMNEQQAEILTAYWNSVRGYTASIDSKMDLVLANMGVGAENNPMLDQLIAQTSVLNNIYSFLQSMTTAAPTASQFSGRVWKSSI